MERKCRSRIDIYAGILSVCDKPKRLMNILVDARLWGGLYANYIQYLVDRGLLTKTSKGYVITEKGREWLKHYMALMELEK